MAPITARSLLAQTLGELLQHSGNSYRMYISRIRSATFKVTVWLVNRCIATTRVNNEPDVYILPRGCVYKRGHINPIVYTHRDGNLRGPLTVFVVARLDLVYRVVLVFISVINPWPQLIWNVTEQAPFKSSMTARVPGSSKSTRLARLYILRARRRGKEHSSRFALNFNFNFPGIIGDSEYRSQKWRGCSRMRATRVRVARSIGRNFFIITSRGDLGDFVSRCMWRSSVTSHARHSSFFARDYTNVIPRFRDSDELPRSRRALSSFRLIRSICFAIRWRN